MTAMKNTAVLAGAWIVSLLFVHNLCNLIFRCGCAAPWAGADRRCNVHHLLPPHCPWCSHGLAGFLWVPAVILVAEAVAIFGLRKRGLIIQVLGAGASYFVIGAAAGLVSALLDGYPRWFGLSLS